MKKYLILSLIICLILTGCGSKDKAVPEDNPDYENEPTLNNPGDYYQFEYPVEGDLCADIYILDYGHVYVKLFDKDAKNACDNFVTKARKGEYDGTVISGFEKDYYIQGGSCLDKEKKEESIWGGGFSNEISDRLNPYRGALCMANQGTDGTNAMQFFIVTAKAEKIKNLDVPLRERYGMSFREYIESMYFTKLTQAKLDTFYEYGGAPWITGHNTVFGQVFKGFSVLDKLNEDLNGTDKNVYIKKITVYEHV